MIFIRNDIDAVEKAGVIGRSFYLLSRTSIPVLVREARRFRREITEFKPDLVHVHYGTVSAMFCAVLTPLRLPLIITYQGSDLNPSPGMNRVRWAVGKVLSQLAALRATRILCVSRELKERLWWKNAKAEVLPSGVNTAMFQPLSKCEARVKLGWSQGDKVVISSAGTDPVRKRLDLVQAAVENAQLKCGPIRLVVLDGRTEHEDIPILFNAADCFLLTSESEGSPNVIKEAMACNLPVVSVDVGDVRERLRGVNSSRMVSRDPLEIGTALAEMLTKPERSNGADIIKHLSAENVARHVLHLYSDVLKR